MTSCSFTDRVRTVLARAQDEAKRLGHDYVAPEHILIALLHEPDGVAWAVLLNLGAVPEDLVKKTEAAAGRPTRRVPGGKELAYTSMAKRVLELSVAAARRLGHDYVGTEHVLLGLLGDTRLRSREVLESAGVTLDVAESAVGHLLDGARASGPGTRAAFMGGADVSPPATSESPVWFLKLDGSASTPIYEQIVARVEEAVATGKLAEGERMPTVRDLAEELSIAPGTVARAYSDLESRGVLETAGARGTRVANRKKSAAAVPEAELEGLLKPVVVAAFHLGATAKQLRDALNGAMRGILSGLL
jgi:DNA-binding transcriptional regulator YhcF (GntR family)